MAASIERQQRVAASFTNQYYTLMLQKPEMLSAFYIQDASFDHMGHKAEGVEEIQAAIKKLYTMQSDGTVKVHTLSAVSDKTNIHITIKGTITLSEGESHNFTHEVELMEHETQPGSFGIVSDKRENTVSEEAPKRWALETPPMFAKEPEVQDMERIEQLPAMTTVSPVEKTSLKKTELSATTKTVSNCDAVSSTNATTTATGSPSAPRAEVNGATTAVAQPKPTPAAEAKRPRSFAEAILMGKSSSSSQAHTTPLMVVAKEAKETSTTPVASTKDKKGSVTHAAGKISTKNTYKNGTVTKKSVAASVSGESETKNERQVTAGSNGKGGHTNDSQNKRKNSDGRTLSRFVVFYDIIVKGLPTDATEQTVREIVEPTAPTKLVKLVSRSDKKDPSITRTFAFVQLDHNAIKNSGDDVKMTVAKVLAANKGKKGHGGQHIQVDEVREKYTAAPNNGTVETST